MTNEQAVREAEDFVRTEISLMFQRILHRAWCAGRAAACTEIDKLWPTADSAEDYIANITALKSPYEAEK